MLMLSLAPSTPEAARPNRSVMTVTFFSQLKTFPSSSRNRKAGGWLTGLPTVYCTRADELTAELIGVDDEREPFNVVEVFAPVLS